MLIVLEAAVTLICVVLFVWMLVRSFLVRRKLRRLIANLNDMNHDICPGCGYDMRESAVRCPECGREVKQTERDLLDLVRKNGGRLN